MNVLWNETNRSLYRQNTVNANRQNPINIGPNDTNSLPTNMYDFLIKKDIWQSSFSVFSLRMYSQPMKQVTPSKISIYRTVNKFIRLARLEQMRKNAINKSGKSVASIWLTRCFIYVFLSIFLLILNFRRCALCLSQIQNKNKVPMPNAK